MVLSFHLILTPQPEAELPFEPVQPSQQRLATQASPQTSGFTSGESTIHEIPAPARPPVARDVRTARAREEPRETVGETPAQGVVETEPLNPPGWRPYLPTPYGPKAFPSDQQIREGHARQRYPDRLQSVQDEVRSRWTDPSHWEGYQEWRAHQWRPHDEEETQRETFEQQQRQERRAQ